MSSAGEWIRRNAEQQALAINELRRRGYRLVDGKWVPPPQERAPAPAPSPPAPRRNIATLEQPRSGRRQSPAEDRFTGFPKSITVPRGIRTQIDGVVWYDRLAFFAFYMYRGQVSDFFGAVRPYWPSTRDVSHDHGLCWLNPWLFSVMFQYAPDDSSRLGMLQSAAVVDVENEKARPPLETRDERQLALREAFWLSGAAPQYTTAFGHAAPEAQFLRQPLPAGWACQWDTP